MNDNDCVSREAILSKAIYFEHDNLLAVCVQDIKDIPAVPQEMRAGDYARTRARICMECKGCGGCPLIEVALAKQTQGCDGCIPFEYDYPDEAVSIVERWAKEHPEERSE